LFKKINLPNVLVNLFFFSHYIFIHTAVTRKIVSQDENTVL